MKIVGLISAIALMAAVPALAQNNATGTGTGTSTSTSNSQSGSAAQGVVGPGGSNSIIGSNANSGSNANANTRSQSRSESSGNANAQNINFNSPGNTSANDRTQVNYGGGTASWNNQNGDVTVRTTPQVYAPPVSGGNPCTLAVSGGVSVIGWGAAAGGTFVDEACATRQKIAMIHNAGYAGAAKELMCDDRASYNAFKTAGQPCAFRAAFEPPGTPPTATPLPQPVPQPTPVTSTQIAPQPQATQRTLPRCSRTVTDNCYSG